MWANINAFHTGWKPRESQVNITQSQFSVLSSQFSQFTISHNPNSQRAPQRGCQRAQWSRPRLCGDSCSLSADVGHHPLCQPIPLTKCLDPFVSWQIVIPPLAFHTEPVEVLLGKLLDIWSNNREAPLSQQLDAFSQPSFIFPGYLSGASQCFSMQCIHLVEECLSVHVMLSCCLPKAHFRLNIPLGFLNHRISKACITPLHLLTQIHHRK